MAWAVACEFMPLRRAAQGLLPMCPGMLPLMSGLVAPKSETVAVMSVHVYYHSGLNKPIIEKLRTAIDNVAGTECQSLL
jgi:hypothetical protein